MVASIISIEVKVKVKVKGLGPPPPGARVQTMVRDEHMNCAWGKMGWFIIETHAKTRSPRPNKYKAQLKYHLVNAGSFSIEIPGTWFAE